MVIDGEATSSTAMSYEASRGAGGKLRRQSARKHSATPYSRPPQAQRSRWISRIVDPAYRIIASGATRVLPYFFSKENTAIAAPAPDIPELDQGDSQSSLEELAEDKFFTPIQNKLDSTSAEVRGTRSTANRKQTNAGISIQAEGKLPQNDDDGISELEKLMEGRKFSRDEVDRLLEIINSRAVDAHDGKREKKNIEMPSNDETGNFGISIQKRKEPIGGKEETTSDLWATSTPFMKSNVPDEAGLAPAELAKAYMGGQTPNVGSLGLASRRARDYSDGDMLTAKPLMASPSYKPSPAWPGAKSTEQCGFGTPQIQSDRFGLHNLPRTPYSRSILSKSKSKHLQLQDDRNKSLSVFNSPSKHVQTPYAQLKPNKGFDSIRGSVGPNRRIRNCTTTPSRMSPYSRPSGGTSQLGTSEGFFPALRKDQEPRGPSSFSRLSQATTGTPAPPHSSQIARTILEHLDRKQPTLKDKSAELKLATSWRKSPSSDADEQKSLNSNNGSHYNDVTATLNENTGGFVSNSLSSTIPRPASGTITSSKAENATNKAAPALNGLFGGTHAGNSGGSALLFGSGLPKDSLAKSKHVEGATKAVIPPSPGSQSPGTKPVLASISIAKPIQRWAFPSDSTGGFSFQVPSCGVSSEPPTPSMTPSTGTPPDSAPTKTMTRDDDDDDGPPQFSFGANIGTPSLDFSAPFGNDTSPIPEGDLLPLDRKFTFGSENPQRVCFGSVGNDALCF